MGPRLSAGKKVSAPTMRMTPTNSTVNKVVFTGNVPDDGGTLFFCARLPARASMGTIIRNRPASMFKARVRLYQLVLVVRPPKAEPLLPAVDTYAYRISERPWGPLLPRP